MGLVIVWYVMLAKTVVLLTGNFITYFFVYLFILLFIYFIIYLFIYLLIYSFIHGLFNESDSISCCIRV